MKRYKLGDRQFKAFKEETLKMWKWLGLQSWRLRVEHTTLKESDMVAQCVWWGDARHAEIYLAKSSSTRFSIEEIKKIARHEVAHLLLADFELAFTKGRKLIPAQEEEVRTAAEKLVNRITQSWGSSTPSIA